MKEFKVTNNEFIEKFKENRALFMQEAMEKWLTSLEASEYFNYINFCIEEDEWENYINTFKEFEPQLKEYLKEMRKNHEKERKTETWKKYFEENKNKWFSEWNPDVEIKDWDTVKVCYWCEAFWVNNIKIDWDNVKWFVDNFVSPYIPFFVWDEISFKKSNIYYTV